MELQSLIDYVSSFEDVEDLERKKVEGAESILFIFRDTIAVTIKAEELTMSLSVSFTPKPLATGKIEKAFSNWAEAVFDDHYGLAVLSSFYNVHDLHVFNIALMEEVLDLIPKIINSFVNDFVPSIKDFVKGEIEFE